MSRKKVRYSKLEYVLGIIVFLTLCMIKYPIFFFFVIGVLFFVAVYYYLLTFRKYSKSFLIIKDHLFIISMIRFWRIRNKIILGIVFFSALAILQEVVSNIIITVLLNIFFLCYPLILKYKRTT